MDFHGEHVGFGGQAAIPAALGSAEILLRRRERGSRSVAVGLRHQDLAVRLRHTEAQRGGRVSAARVGDFLPMAAERLADSVRTPSNTSCSAEMPVRKFDVGSGWFSASIAKLASVKLRCARSDPNTNTGWLPRCHDSARSSLGYQPDLACRTRSDASRWAACAPRTAGCCFSAGQWRRQA